MVKTLELAFSKAAALPDAAQEKIGRQLLDYLEALAQLRAEVDVGIKQLDAGECGPLDIEDVIKQARAQHAANAK